MSYYINNNRLYARRALSLSLARNKYKRPKHTNKVNVKRGNYYYRLLRRPDK